ncbi:MAG: hypothetical protein KF749_03865 [Bacteroidetes bacterium]|nr:hypothetical protein [Bacteroidota bacterium]MCW5897495.1 hypothetical protein [Bacteroidota bacterium]
MKGIRFAVVFSLLTGFGACKETNTIDARAFVVSEIGVNEVPQFGSTSFIFFYNSNLVNPETLLSELIAAGIPVVQAWLPLDNRCADPVGARFTVELSENDTRIENYGFARGAGRLECATKLKHYAVKG